MNELCACNVLSSRIEPKLNLILLYRERKPVPRYRASQRFFRTETQKNIFTIYVKFCTVFVFVYEKYNSIQLFSCSALLDCIFPCYIALSRNRFDKCFISLFYSFQLSFLSVQNTHIQVQNPRDALGNFSDLS